MEPPKSGMSPDPDDPRIGRTGRGILVPGCLLILGLLLSTFPGPAPAQVQLNCLMCHKHRGLSRVDEEGNFRLFYINEDLFESSPHARNACQDCHSDIDRIPHEPAKKVDCTQQCHLIEPAGQKTFSHKTIAETLAKSVHASVDADGKPKPHPQDYPGCKDCHDQPLYRPLSFFKGVQPGVSQRGISRCKSCHPRGDFAESFYNHVTSRLHKTRSPKEMIRVCAKCHEDEGVMSRHSLDDVVASYRQTFHYKLIALGSEETPDCVDCHVVYGESSHLIEGKDTSTSSVFKHNVPTTCRTAECHEKAGANLAGFKTHVTYAKDKYPMQFYMLLFFKGLLATVMYFFLTFIFLELLRRLFPNFSFNKEERDLAKARNVTS